jgi:hypothetical protein
VIFRSTVGFDDCGKTAHPDSADATTRAAKEAQSDDELKIFSNKFI